MSALDTQVGGDHYKSAAIQPVQYIEANDLKFLEGCVVKRVTRHNKPTGKGRQDIEKAIHELQLLLELRYPVVDDSATDHPAWPNEKAYRWMAQDADGRWFAYNYQPEEDVSRWVSDPDEAIPLPSVRERVPNSDWRDTLIERGADE